MLYPINSSVSIALSSYQRELSSRVEEKPHYPAKVSEVKGIDDFNKKLSSYPRGVTVIYFSATWCRPCQKHKPKFAKLAKQYKGSVQFLYLDTDKNDQLAEIYRIDSLPAFIIVKGGSVVKVENHGKLDQDIKLVLSGKHPGLKLSSENIIAEIHSSDPGIRKRAIGKLIYYLEHVKRDDRLIELFIDVLNDPISDITPSMVKAVTRLEIKDKRIVEPLINFLGSKDPALYEEALWAIAKSGIRDERFIEPLIRALGDIRVCWIAVDALRKQEIQDKRSIEPLVQSVIQSLEDDNVCWIWVAAFAIGELGMQDKRFVEPLIKALESGLFSVREKAAKMIGKLGIKDKRFIEPLIKALGDEDREVHLAAAEAIKKLKIDIDKKEFKQEELSFVIDPLD